MRPSMHLRRIAVRVCDRPRSRVGAGPQGLSWSFMDLVKIKKETSIKKTYRHATAFGKSIPGAHGADP